MVPRRAPVGGQNQASRPRRRLRLVSAEYIHVAAAASRRRVRGVSARRKDPRAPTELEATTTAFYNILRAADRERPLEGYSRAGTRSAATGATRGEKAARTACGFPPRTRARSGACARARGAHWRTWAGPAAADTRSRRGAVASSSRFWGRGARRACGVAAMRSLLAPRSDPLAPTRFDDSLRPAFDRDVRAARAVSRPRRRGRSSRSGPTF